MTDQFKYIGRTMGNVSIEESAAITYIDSYEMNQDDFLSFVARLPRKGRIVLNNPAFTLKSAEARRIGKPDPSGKIVVEVERQAGPLALENPEQEKDQNGDPTNCETPPWLYRLENFRCSSTSEETTPTVFYPSGSDLPIPFANTAGVALQAESTRGLMAITFNYNARSLNVNGLWLYKDKINATPIQIAGILFPARTVKIENISGEEKTILATDGSALWRYVAISVELLCDPKSWNRDFLNVGSCIATRAGLQRIWQWTNSSGTTVYGSYSNALNSNAEDVEEITEPLFLNENGTAISPFGDNGKQIPTYLTGSLFQPADFSPLGFPAIK